MVLPFLALLALAQTTPLPPPAANPAPSAKPSDRLPPANPLPPPGTDEAGVMTPVTALFAALAARDGQAVLAQVKPEGTAVVAVEKADGTRTTRQMRLAEFAAGLTPGPEKYEERLLDPAIEIDGDIAMVWGRYVFLLNGQVEHCGADHFSLVRENGQWKIAHIAWSQRSTGCAE